MVAHGDFMAQFHRAAQCRGMRPKMVLMNVVLPTPLSPIRATREPRSSFKSGDRQTKAGFGYRRSR